MIDTRSMKWNINFIEQHFNESDVQGILSIPLSSLNHQDELTWALTKDGHYSVKTAYMLGKGGNLDVFYQAWVDIWGMNVSPKVKHFLWRSCTNSLPTHFLLKFRHLIEDDLFPWGCGEIESTSHALFTCHRVAVV